MRALISSCLLAAAVAQYAYNVEVLTIGPLPVVSWVEGNTVFQQNFNPSWVVPSATQKKQGLLVRSQNCSASVGGSCVRCDGTGQQASVITFAEATVATSTDIAFKNVSASSVVFAPSQGQFDDLGTEDPRIQLDPNTGTYYMFYTSYGTMNSGSVLLSLATTQDPTNPDPDAWTHHGAVFPWIQGSKSAALILRASGPHFLLWGSGTIRITNSTDPTLWSDPGAVIIAARGGMFDSNLVESGPPPLLLSTGDYFFLYNSEDGDSVFHVGWAILSGADPTQILARSSDPLLSPTMDWEQGIFPWTCNVPNVIFIEAAFATEKQDVFRVFYGGSDAVVGTATVYVQASKLTASVQ